MSRTAIGLLWVVLVAASTGCESRRHSSTRADDNARAPSATDESPSEESDPDDSDQSQSDQWGRRDERREMVRTQIAGRGLEDEAVLEAMRQVPRHRFVPLRRRHLAYEDSPLPIGHDQTISQPYIVAAMTRALQADSTHNVLEIGTGSGYQAAVLSKIVSEVYTIEIVCDLAEQARRRFDDMGYDNIHVTCGDGYAGWPEHAPFDRIIVTAAPESVPDALVDQLADGGRMVIPVGDTFQELRLVVKDDDGQVSQHKLMGVRFVPMVHGDDTDAGR